MDGKYKNVYYTVKFKVAVRRSALSQWQLSGNRKQATVNIMLLFQRRSVNFSSFGLITGGLSLLG